MRKSYQELEKIKKKYSVLNLWSWSKYNSYKTSTYEYYLKYIIRAKEDRATSFYMPSGNASHQILENYYTKQITYDQMIIDFEEEWFKLINSNLKFDRCNKEKNQAIADKYEDCMKHFFKNHIPVTKKVDIERFILVKVGKFIFQGYIDCVHKEGNDFIITDFKTSSLYKGDKIKKECGQLLLYSEALYQLGVPYENIKIRWNFLKYVTVEQQQANGKSTFRHIERNDIGESLKSNVKTWLKKSKEYSENQMEEYLEQLVDTNDIKCLPNNIQSKYKITDCYGYVDYTQKDIDNLKNDIIETIVEISKKEAEYNKTKDDKIWWEDIDDKKSYYFANLSSYSAKLNKPYGEYLDKLKSKKNDDVDVSSEDEDLSWLLELD